MIYTSYFANWRNFPEGFTRVRIALWPPKYKVPIDKVALELAPTKQLLLGYKSGLISKEEYEIQFNNRLANLDPKVIAVEYNNSVLICYEKSGDFCHRNLIRVWLNQNGVTCDELSNKRSKEVLDIQK